MSGFLQISVRFLDPISSFHGQRDDNEPEWPPSPLRLFQSLVDASASRWRKQQFQECAQPLLDWLERLGQPEIIAPTHSVGTPFRIAVPNNDLDVWAGPISKGNEPKKQPNELKTMKLVRRVHTSGEALHYLFPLSDAPISHLEVLKTATRSVTHLGWGIDMVAADAAVISQEEADKLPGHRWRVVSSGGTPLRVPRAGTLDDLIRKHNDFLNRVTENGFRPVPPLREFDIVRYRSQNEATRRSYRLFELRNLDGSRFRYSHRKLIHIAGMVRHLAIETMTKVPPRRVENDWVETFVAGHKADGSNNHHQLSYVPLPSAGHTHVDPGVRRVMIVAPTGDDAWLDHIAQRLAGQQLIALNDKTPEFGVDNDGQPKSGPILVPLRRTGDGVTRAYTSSSSVWHSYTPIILSGHDDHKPVKTLKLIEKALAQSDIKQPCEFEWSAFSHFPKSYSAHKYGKDKQPQGYIRPSHLLSQTAVHLTLRFHDGSNEQKSVQVSGPLTIGAGRHCGFGLMAAQDD